MPCGYGGCLLGNLSAVGTNLVRRFDVGNDLNRTLFTLTAEAEAKRPDDPSLKDRLSEMTVKAAQSLLQSIDSRK